MEYENLVISILVFVVISMGLYIGITLFFKNQKHWVSSKKLDSIRLFRKVLDNDKVIREMAKKERITFEQKFDFSLKDGAIIIETIIGGQEMGNINVDLIYGDGDIASQLFDHYERIEKAYSHALLMRSLEKFAR